jgi:hypothetical protein
MLEKFIDCFDIDANPEIRWSGEAMLGMPYQCRACHAAVDIVNVQGVCEECELEGVTL